jgi:hypothetical protein
VGIVGDSYSNDSTNTWGNSLITSLNSDYAGIHTFTEENPRTWAQQGINIFEAAAQIDGWIESHRYVPGHEYFFLINLGANNFDQVFVDADLINAYIYIIDSLRNKFINAQFLLSYPSARGHLDDANAMALLIDQVIAARSSYVFAGDDERIWKEGGDDYATNTYDGSHYSTPAGQLAKEAAVRVRTLAIWGW